MLFNKKDFPTAKYSLRRSVHPSSERTRKIKKLPQTNRKKGKTNASGRQLLRIFPIK